jgi:hypothetical protein
MVIAGLTLDQEDHQSLAGNLLLKAPEANCNCQTF